MIILGIFLNLNLNSCRTHLDWWHHGVLFYFYLHRKMDFQFRWQDGCCFDKTNWHISVNLLARSSSGLRPGGDRYKAVGKWWFVVIIHFWQNKIDLAHNFLFASWESCVQICWFALSLNPNKIILTRCLDRYVAQQDQTAFPSLFSSTLCQTAPSKFSFPV